MAKRLFILGFDLFFVAITAFAVSAVCAPCAYAYVDPSVMTYTIQALAGVAVALSAIAGVAFRRVRKKLIKALNIDENANKIVEPPIHRINPQTGEVIGDCEAPVKVQSDRRSIFTQAKQPNGSKLSWLKRLGLAALVSVFVVFTAFVEPVFEMYVASGKSLNVNLTDVIGLVIGAALLVALVTTLLLSVVSGRVFDMMLGLLFALGLCIYIQVMFLNGGLPIADGTTPVWSDFRNSAIKSLVVWLAVCLILIVLNVKKIKIARGVTVALCAALILVQGAGVVGLCLSPDMEKAEKPFYVTKEGLFSVSPKNNTIVFVLDTLDTDYVEGSLDMHPQMLDDLEDFTWYKENAGGMIPTYWGVSFLFTGITPGSNDHSTSDVGSRVSASNTIVPDIASSGYSVGVYSDTLSLVENQIADDTVNIRSFTMSNFDSMNVLKTLTKCALYRDAPWSWKQYFHYTTDDINLATAAGSDVSKDDETLYAMDDTSFYHELQNRGLQASDEGENGAFRFIHLLGCHLPYTMTADGEASSQLTSEDAEVAGSFVIVGEYLDQLKEMGLYDNATIIITADHGKWYPGLNGVDPEVGPSNPALFVKPAKTSGGASLPVATSDAPTDAGDVLPTILASVNADYSQYGSPVYDIPNTERGRYFYWLATDYAKDKALMEYYIDGDPRDLSSWTSTGNEWPDM